jgi:rod shape-determining protein MreD
MYFVLSIIFFLQVTLLDLIRISNTKPDLGSLFVIFIAIFFGWGAGLEAGFVFGLLKDIYSMDIFGINTASLALTGFVTGFLSHKFFRESVINQVSIVFVFTLFSFFIHYIIVSVVSSITYISLSEYLFFSFIPVSLYTAFISFFVFPFLINKFGLKEDAEYL